MEVMNDELGRAHRPSDSGAPPSEGAALREEGEATALPASSPAAAAQAPDPGAAVPPASRPRRAPRAFTWLLLFLLALVAVLASQVRKPPTYVHVADGPPPIEAPTGALAEAFELARDAAVRIEARCGSGRNGHPVGVGSGFFASDDGLVLTAYHVVDSTATSGCNVRWVAITAQEEVFPLTLVGFDAFNDLAALKADVDRRVPFLPLAERAPTPGTPVVAIGNSRDDFLAARAGRVTRLGVQANRADFADGTIELTNSLAPGDSGGPVVNARGEAIGVVSYISFNPGAMTTQEFMPPFLRGLSLSRDFAGYAVPLTAGSEIVSEVVAGARRDLPVIGFSWQTDYQPGRGPHDLGPRPGPIVHRVARGGPADVAGLRPMGQKPVTNADGSVGVDLVADVIVALDGVPTPTFYDLLALVKARQIGDVVTLTVQRDNATFRLELELGAKTSVFAND